MPAIAVNPPFPLFTDADGQPLDDAYIYIGTANQNPVSNPITVYWDSALTITATQPIRTSGGYPVYNGTPARFYTNSDYSILVRDKNGAFVYTAAGETDFISSEFVTFIQSGGGAIQRSAQDKLRDIVSVKDFGAVGNGVVDDAPAIQLAVNANTGKTIFFPAGTYYMATAAAGAYLTLAGAGTTLLLDRNAKLLFLDAAVYGINITAQMCTVRGGMLWGTNTTSPALTVACRIAAPYCVVEGNNIAYASIGTQVSATYVVKHLNNVYSNCDRYFRTSGSCADVQSRGNTYGTTTIGANAVVEINGSGGADLHDYWETQQRTKLSLACNTGSQRVQVRGKIFDSGGVTVGTSVFCRLDVENQLSYTGTSFLAIAGGGSCDATGSWLNGPGITSGVTAVVGDGNFNMASGSIIGWQVGCDLNAGAYISAGTLISQCTTGVDIATASSGIVNPVFSSNTTNIVRTTSSITSLPNAYAGSATYDPPNLADGAGATTTITVTGARAGDTAAVSFSNDLQGIILSSWVTTDTVNVRFQNETGGALDLASGTLRATISTKTI